MELYIRGCPNCLAKMKRGPVSGPLLLVRQMGLEPILIVFERILRLYKRPKLGRFIFLSPCR